MAEVLVSAVKGNPLYDSLIAQVVHPLQDPNPHHDLRFPGWAPHSPVILAGKEIVRKSQRNLRIDLQKYVIFGDSMVFYALKEIELFAACIS